MIHRSRLAKTYKALLLLSISQARKHAVSAYLAPVSNRCSKIVLVATCDDNIVDLKIEEGILALVEIINQLNTHL